MADFALLESSNWFHVKSEWQKKPEISTLCFINLHFWILWRSIIWQQVRKLFSRKFLLQMLVTCTPNRWSNLFWMWFDLRPGLKPISEWNIWGFLWNLHPYALKNEMKIHKILIMEYFQQKFREIDVRN